MVDINEGFIGGAGDDCADVLIDAFRGVNPFDLTIGRCRGKAAFANFGVVFFEDISVSNLAREDASAVLGCRICLFEANGCSSGFGVCSAGDAETSRAFNVGTDRLSSMANDEVAGGGTNPSDSDATVTRRGGGAGSGESTILMPTILTRANCSGFALWDFDAGGVE